MTITSGEVRFSIKETGLGRKEMLWHNKEIVSGSKKMVCGS